MIFVDTGAFLARYARKDPFRNQALPAWRDVFQERVQLVTSNFVLDESLTLLARRTSYAFAAATARDLYGTSGLEILRPELADELAALPLFEKFADQEVSFTDCISFILMRKHRIQRAFSFDRHFRLAGFETIP